jgi:alpha-tubulin suppressor-like RCC1 family protein
MNQTKVPADLLVARDVTSPLRVVMLAAGANHTLALRANGTVAAWGDNKSGQMTGITAWSNVVQVAAGSRHSLALLSDGTIVGVGNNTFNQLNIPQISNVVKITVAANHNVALIRDGSMVAWGRNLYGQIDIPAEMRAADVWAMYDNTVVLQTNGQVAVIGSPLFDQDDVPAEAFQRIGVGNYHVLAITKAGAVRAWGLDTDDQLAVPDSLVSPYMVTGGSNFSVALSADVSSVPTSTATPSRMPVVRMPVVPTSAPLLALGGVIAWDLGTIPAVSATTISSMVMTSDTIGIVRSDGSVMLSQSTASTPQTLPANAQTNVQQLGLGDGFGAVIKRDHSLFVWGSAAPTIPARFLTNVGDIAIAGDHLLVRSIDGKVWSNLFALDTVSSAKHIAAGPTFAVILLNDGSVFVAAPDNDEGLLSVPTFSSAVSEIAAGDQHILALQNDGTLVAWGAEQSDAGQADIPYEAMYNVVAMAASDQMSIALRSNNVVVAWGDIPASTASQLTTIATNKNAAAVVAGGGKLAVITNGAPIVGGSATRTRMPSQTAIVFPTVTPRTMNNGLLANMSGWFPMDGAESRLEYAGSVARYLCPNPYDCPISDPNGVVNRAAQFRASRTDEISGNVPIALGNKSFTVSYWLRRDERDVEDVVFSMGALAKVRQYLTMGMDQENRVYCSFFGDDLRSVEWFNDYNWHHYACTFNQSNRIRQLYRDGRLIAQDMVMSAVNIPSSPIMFGERYDNMAGLVGAVDNFVVHDRALTATELQSYTQLPTQNRLETVSFDDMVFPGVSPNRSMLLCVTNVPCPDTIRDSHNEEALLLTGTDQLQLNHPTVKLTNGFTMAYWAKRNTTDNTNEVVLSQGTIESMFVMGIYADQEAFCQINSTVLKSMISTDTEWHHYACTYNRVSDVLSLYVDGVFIDSVLTTDYAGLGTVYVGRMNQTITNVRGLNGLVDDVMIYNAVVPAAVVRNIYNITNPPAPIATLVVTPNRSATATATFTAVRLPTNTPRRGPSKTRLPATMTPNIAVVRTNTSTLTPTITPTVNRTLIAAGTATFTASATPTASNTRGPTTPTRTRTPLLMTRTMLAKLSPTWGAQTLTATYQSQAATHIAATATERAAMTATSVASTHVAATLTAYPPPPTATRTPTAYPYP